ncbi:hypothetical protein ACVRWG_09540 [Streptococcus uberis]|uniref:hypothetical protein n=1 Tax=Streptococcus uberis TaxID=1349 RepID=UPI000DBE3FAE|nr:hypothetical protein [Streptococcus uberis]
MEVITIAYLTQDEFTKDFGFDEINDFEKLLKRAEVSINLFLNGFYDFVDFDKEIEHRKQAVKMATALQVVYLDTSGIMTADDKQSLASVSLGRTSVSYKDTSKTSLESSMYNLSLDALNILKRAGFGYRGVGYDRY